MGRYIENIEDMKFKSMKDLKKAEQIIDEADKALNDKSRKLSDALAEKTASGTGLNYLFDEFIDWIKSWFVSGYGFMNAKLLLCRKAVEKMNAIDKALQEERDADKERIEYLKSLDAELWSVSKNLGHDLGMNLGDD